MRHIYVVVLTTIVLVHSGNGEITCEMISQEYQDKLREELKTQNCFQVSVERRKVEFTAFVRVTKLHR